jgi:hypothetical protein
VRRVINELKKVQLILTAFSEKKLTWIAIDCDTVLSGWFSVLELTSSTLHNVIAIREVCNLMFLKEGLP